LAVGSLYGGVGWSAGFCEFVEFILLHGTGRKGPVRIE
jgi:hypothetical protein